MSQISETMPRSTQEGEPGQLPNGAAVAACLAGVVGMLAQGIAVTVTYNDDAVKAAMINFGQVLPVVGWNASGPFAGHEAVMLFSWLIAWVVLHLLLSRKQFNGPAWLYATLGGVGVTTLLLWPPIYMALRGGAH